MRVIPLKALIAYGILCLGLVVGSAWAQGTNVALGKTATGSSVWEAASSADKVVDGITNLGHPNQFHSGSGDRYPWWQVDLGQVYLIQRIVIWNRVDCCQTRLRDIIVQIKGPGDIVLFETVVNPGNVLNNPPTITITPPVTPGQFVRVSRTPDEVNLTGDDQYLLQLAEVEVFGHTPLQAYGPTPQDGAARVGANAANVNQVDVNLAWNSGVEIDPEDPNKVIVDPLLVSHKVYISNPGSTDPNNQYLGEVAAGTPPQSTAQFGPVTLDRDATYTWRVDEIRNVSGNMVTTKGPHWTFSTESAKPVILSLAPVSQFAWSVESAPIAGEIVESVSFAVQAENPYSKDASGMTFEWYKVITGGDVKVSEGSATFTIPTIANADAGQYYCVVVLANPAIGTMSQSSNVTLNIKHILGHWPFDGNYTDIIAGNNGSDIGGPLTYEPGIVPASGGTGQAVRFNGSGSQALTVPTAAIAPNSSWSFSFWEYTNSSVAAGYIMASGSPNGYEKLYIWRREGTAWADGNTDYYGNLNGTPTGWTGITGSIGPIYEYFPRLQWHQITWTYDYSANFYVWYVDGSARASANAPAPLDAFDTVFYFGNRRNMQRPYTGFIDDFRVYDYTMSAREVAEQYLKIKGGYFCWTPVANDLNGDCVINIADLALMAADWTNCNLVPASACQ